MFTTRFTTIEISNVLTLNCYSYNVINVNNASRMTKLFLNDIIY